jgi:hypothetical protein
MYNDIYVDGSNIHTHHRINITNLHWAFLHRLSTMQSLPNDISVYLDIHHNTKTYIHFRVYIIYAYISSHTYESLF